MPAVSLLLEPYDPPQNEEEIFANIQAQDDYAQAGVAQATASAAVLPGVEKPQAGGGQANRIAIRRTGYRYGGALSRSCVRRRAWRGRGRGRYGGRWVRRPRA